MVAPLSFVRDVHPLLALASGRRHRAVRIEDRLLEKRRRLLTPHPKPHLVDHVHQRLDIRHREPPAKVARSGRVGNTLRPKGVQKDFIIPPQLDVIQTGAPSQNVVCDVQHVVRLVVRQMHLEQMQLLIDGLDQPRPAGQQVHRANASRPQPVGPATQLVVDVAGGQHGLFGRRPVPVAEPALDSALAIGYFFSFTLTHSKCLLASKGCGW